MNSQHLAGILSKAGLHHESIQQLVETYDMMESHLERGEYTRATEQVETFCKVYVHVLNIELGEPLERDTDVQEFVTKSRNGEIAGDAPASVREFIPDMLNSAIDTARPRDTGAIGIGESINRSDARVGVSIASWLVVELVRLYIAEDEFEDANEIESLITEVVRPIKERPLNDLVRSRYEFDERLPARELTDIVYLVHENEQVVKGPNFPNDQKKKITALLLGRVAAYNLGFSETLGAEGSWINDHIGGVASTGTFDSLPFVFEVPIRGDTISPDIGSVMRLTSLLKSRESHF
jgi:hypothetical protein